MRTAYLYIRVSTDEQADTGYSQRSQDEMLRRYCELNNIAVKHAWFEDHSAKNFNRPQFTNMLMQLRKHRGIVDLILFTKWDRFSRNAGDAYAMISTLNKLGVDPQAVEQPLDLSIPENKMMLAFYLAAPEVENDRRAMNVISGMRRAQKEGRYMGKAPVGYINKISENGKKYIAPNTDTKYAVQWAFQEMATGKFTAESVMKRMNELYGLKCSKNNFWNMLRNAVYCGKIKVDAYKTEEEQLVHGQHEALVSEALFYEVQDVLDGKKKIQRTKVAVDDRFPLRGFIQCPECGRLLTASSSKGRKHYYEYYHCISSCGVRYKSDCVHDAFTKELHRWKPHPAVLQLYFFVNQEIYFESDEQRRVEMKKIKEEMTRLTDRQTKARELLMSDAMEADDYKAIKRECERQMMQLDSRMALLSKKAPNIDPQVENAIALLNEVDSIYSAADVATKRNIVDSIFPEKLVFDGIGYRTARINEAVQVMFNLGAAFGEIKMGQVEKISDLSHQVNQLVRFSNHFLFDLRKLSNLYSSLKIA